MRDAAGQATIEWVGLVLVAALVLGALAAFRAPAQDRGLGTALARRITCAAGGACAATPPAGALGPIGARGAAGGRASGLPRNRRISRAKAVDAFRRLRGLGRLTNRIWIVCLGYRRFLYERRNVLEPSGAMPFDKALDVADDCLNPLSFGEDE